jgi:hypothetical protein
MKNYLENAIKDTLQRSILLKELIQHPLPAAELSGLAQICNDKLDEIITSLEQILNDQYFDNRDFFKNFFRKYRRLHQRMSIIEGYGIPVLLNQHDFTLSLNTMLFKIHQEINLPFSAPIAACYSNDYYGTFSDLNIIYLPLAEPFFVLHLPDLFHEIGHIVIDNLTRIKRLEPLKRKYDSTLNYITDHFIHEIRKTKRRTGPVKDLTVLNSLLNQWRDYWYDEIVSDILATYTLGPAYAWSFVHLIAKEGLKKFEFVENKTYTHPCDIARLKIILVSLRVIDLNKEAEVIFAFWNDLSLMREETTPEYDMAYPDDLLEHIAISLHEGTINSNINLYSPRRSKTNNHNSIISLLNLAWNIFWKSEQDFIKWQKNSLEAWNNYKI